MANSTDIKFDTAAIVKFMEQMKKLKNKQSLKTIHPWEFYKEPSPLKEEIKVKPEIKYIDEGII